MLGGKPITLFRVRGIPISVDWSWFLVLFLVIFWLSRLFGNVLDENSSSTAPFLLALVSAFGFFASIVLHELGHAFVAMRNGIGITNIQLWIFGGVAQMDRESDSPSTEFKVAIGGPVVTLAIVAVLGLVGLAIGGSGEFRKAIVLERDAGTSGALAAIAWLASINALVLVFNLLPAFPMDGGRIVRSIAWWRTGDRTSATRFAANLGRVFAYIFIAGGLALAVSGRVFTGVWLVLIGFVINGSARGAAMQTRVSGRIEGVSVADVMDREPVAIPERDQRRAGPRRVLPPLPLGLVPGRRRGAHIPRPRRPRPRRRGPRDLTRDLAGLRTARERRRHLPGPRRRPARLPARQQRPTALRGVDGGRRQRAPVGCCHDRAGGQGASGRFVSRRWPLPRPLRGSS